MLRSSTKSLSTMMRPPHPFSLPVLLQLRPMMPKTSSLLIAMATRSHSPTRQG